MQSIVVIPPINEDLVVRPVIEVTMPPITPKQLSRAEVEPVPSLSDSLPDITEVLVILRPVLLFVPMCLMERTLCVELVMEDETLDTVLLLVDRVILVPLLPLVI